MKNIFKKITLFSLLFSFSMIGYCQLSKKDIKEIPKNYQDSIIYTFENNSGEYLSYRKFKKGEFIPASDSEKRTLMTTMLLGSGTFLYDYLKNKYVDFNPVVIKPNGFTITSFKIKYEFSGGDIFIMRKMRNKNFFTDPMAAENPENYSMIIVFNLDDPKQSVEIKNALISHLNKTHTIFNQFVIK